jgi:ABC-type antimicrobial peptide transport system permease subunit
MREFGIRIALGAERKEVLEAALGRAFKLLAFGSAAGLVLGILASRVLALIVYQRVLFSLCLCWGCSLREE